MIDTHPLLRFFRHGDIRLFAVALSCLFSLAAVLAEPVLNDDAFGYLRAAELFNSAGAGAVLDEYGWYGYSLLIALADRVLPGGPLAAAHLINTAAFGLLVWVFITLMSEYRDGTRVRLFAAVAILVFPLVNEMRHFLVRDFAFWAFCMLALLQLIRYHRHSRARNALGWCLAMLAAIFFRLEGLVLLVLTPLSLLVNGALPWQRRLRDYGLIQLILLIGVVLVYLLCLTLGVDLPELMRYAYRHYLPLLFDFGSVLMSTATALNQSIFTPQNFPGNSGHGIVVLFIAYTYTVAVNLINALTLPVALLLVYGLIGKRYRVSPHASLPALFFLGGSLLSLLIFMFIMHFLTTRYATLAALILLSFVPLCLDDAFRQAWRSGAVRHFHLAFGFFVFYFLVDSLVSFGYSKDYERDAAQWSRDHLATASGELYTNSYTVAYVSGKVPEYDKINKDALAYLDHLKSGDHLAAVIRYDETQLREMLDARGDLELLVNFANERDDQVRIYRVY